MTITCLEVWRHRMQLSEPYAITYETVRYSDNLFLLLHTDGPHVGVGCAAPVEAVTGESLDSAEHFLAEVASPLLAGRDPLRLAALLALVRTHSRGLPAARAAVDMALYDLLAKRAGMPVYQLLGAYRQRIRTSVTIGIHGLEETVRRARERIAEGFSCLKIKGGRAVEEDIERVLAVRSAVGPAVALRFDANQGYSLNDARQFLTGVEAAGLQLLEQPTARSDPHALGEVSRSAAIPIMADESVLGLKDAFSVAKLDLVDMINIKLMKTGGIMEALQINAVARSAGYPTMVGCMDEAGIGVAAGMHFALTRPNIRYADLDGHLDLIGDPSGSALRVHEGYVYPNQQAGLGWTP